MAISASRLPFRSSRQSLSFNVSGAEPSTHQTGLTAGANELSCQGPVSTADTKKAGRKYKINFFHRVSIRISKPDSSPQPDKTDQSDLSAKNLHTPSASNPQRSRSAQSKSRESASCSSYPSDSLEHLKDMVHTASDSPGFVKSRSSRASLFFWKRTSQSIDSVTQEKAIKTDSPEVDSTEDNIPTSISSDGESSNNIPSEISESLFSAQDTTETSASSVEEIGSNDCGMAGIGVRNRNSISLHSLPVRQSLSSTLSPGAALNTNKSPFHPAMRYAPSNSSPLSSRSHSPSEIVASGSNIIIFNPNPASNSSIHQSGTPSVHRQSRMLESSRLSSARLSLVPNQNCIASEELMRFLRGPSSYPEETLPRSNNRSSLYLCV